MKTCWICGTENPDTALRCSFCGIELDMNMKHAPLPKGKGDQGYKPETAPGRAPRPKESRERKRSDRGAVLTLSFTSLTLILTALLVLGSSVFEGVKLLRHFGEDLESTINYYEPVEEEDVLQEDGVSYVGDQMLVVSAPGASYGDMELFFRGQGMEILGYVELIDTYQVRLKRSYTLSELQQRSKALEEDALVDSATVNAVRKNTGFQASGDPWDGRSDWLAPGFRRDNWGVMAIRAPQSWERWEPEDVRVGVIDSVFDESCPDLYLAAVKDNEIFDKLSEGNDKIHGTHVAGTIGAIHGNGIGVAGVAENCRIYGCSALRYEGVLDEVSAIAELAAQDVRVINYSMGTSPRIRDEAMERSGMEREVYYNNGAAFAQTALRHLLAKGHDFVLVCSAGNDPVDAIWASEYTYITEAEIRDRILVVGAAAIDGDGGFYQPAWSAYGDRVDVLAPGVDIYSVVPGGGAYMTGASMAAPHVSGICASVWAISPGLSGAEVKRIVLRTAEIPVSGGDADLVNMYAAMALAEKNGNRT